MLGITFAWSALWRIRRNNTNLNLESIFRIMYCVELYFVEFRAKIIPNPNKSRSEYRNIERNGGTQKEMG